MSTKQDPARLIADRVVRRLNAESSVQQPAPAHPPNGGQQITENRGARIINFVSPSVPPRSAPSITSDPEPRTAKFESPRPLAAQVAQSPWLAPFARTSEDLLVHKKNSQSAVSNPPLIDHPSQERFAVEEAAVSELVEFFENEKQCSVDPSGKPCDHCAMCSSRGF